MLQTIIILILNTEMDMIFVEFSKEMVLNGALEASTN